MFSSAKILHTLFADISLWINDTVGALLPEKSGPITFILSNFFKDE